MKLSINRTLGAVLFCVMLMGQTKAQQYNNSVRPAVNDVVPTVWDIQLPAQNTLTGYLGDRYTENLKNRLLKVDEAGLLDGFTHRPGKHRWIGEHVGKYLEAAVNTWKITKDPALKTQMDRIANTLVATQLPDGYLGTYLPENYWTSWDVWSHKYNLVGLLAYYSVSGDRKFYNAAVKIGDLLCKTFGDNPGQKDIIKAGSHVGMAATSVIDPMVDLYRWTGDKKYVDFCRYIISSYDHQGGPAIINSLLKYKQVNKVANGKAYEMLSNLVGVIKLYRVTGQPELFQASKIAFDDIASKRLFVSGTTSDHEKFKDDFELQADTAAHMGEGCVTTTWIQFSMQLLGITGEMKYFNEIEKSVYNHLLAAENPSTGCVSYYTPLIGVKPYRCHITCCLSSVPRGISLIPYLNYGHLAKMPTVFFYEGADIKDTILVNNKPMPIGLKIQSKFPQQGAAVIAVNIPKTSTFAIQLRVPTWAKAFKATVNGKVYTGKPDELIKISNTWKTADQIAVSFDIPVNVLPGGKSYPNDIAIKRGPQVLALDASLNKASDNTYTISKSPVLSQGKLPSDWIGKQVYQLPVTSKKGAKSQLTLVPYADASQTGGSSTVWIPATVNAK